MNMTTFFDKVVEIGNNSFRRNDVNSNFHIWKDAYIKADNLEKENKNKTFLFSAQHKDCIILSIILTKINDSEK